MRYVFLVVLDKQPQEWVLGRLQVFVYRGMHEAFTSLGHCISHPTILNLLSTTCHGTKLLL